MPEYSVKILVDVQGKKVMDELAKGSGGSSGGGKTGPKSLGGAIGAAKEGIMKGEGIGSVFETLTKSLTGMTAVLGVGIGILLMAVANSKIVAIIFGTIGKLLGFLLDIVLLPLMPLFMMLVRWLYTLILEFRKFTKNLSLKSILDFGVNLLLLTSPLGWVIKLLQWALGEGNIQTAINFGLDILKGAGDWLWGIAEYLFWGNFRLVNTVAHLALDIRAGITGALAGIAEFALSVLKWMWGIGGGPQITKIVMDFLANPVGWIWGFLQALWEGGKGVYNIAAGALGLPKLDTGGEVLKTGVAVVHRGETFSGVTGSGQPGTGSGGNTYYFYNYGQTRTELEMFTRFMDLMRQKGMGLKL